MEKNLTEAEQFLDTYLGGNRNVATLTWNHWVECLSDYAGKARKQCDHARAVLHPSLTTNPKYHCPGCNQWFSRDPTKFPAPTPPIQAVDEAAETEDVNLLKRRLEFYRNETSKIRDYVFDDANKCGYPTQSIFEAITDKIDALKAEIAEHQARQPVRKTLNEVKDEVARKYGYLTDDIHFAECKDKLVTYIERMDEVAEFYASQSKAVEPQQGWVDVKDRLPETGREIVARYYNDECFIIEYNGQHLGFEHYFYLPPKPNPLIKEKE